MGKYAFRIEGIAKMMISSAKAMGKHSEEEGSTHEIELFAWSVLQKRRGARENALKMIAKVGDFLRKVTKKAMGK